MSFSAERFEELRARSATRLGKPCSFLTVTESTNDDALAAARSGAADGSVFVADHQTAGRGRRGRSFFAEPGASLLFSVVLRRALPLDIVPALALASGLGVRSAVAGCIAKTKDDDRRVQLKWPNDVWIDDKKVAGVLAETQIQAGVLVACVVGIGINVSVRMFPSDLRNTATSLLLSGGSTDRERLLLDVLVELETAVQLLEQRGIAGLQPELTRHDALAGRPVRVDGLTGVASGIDTEGRLLVALHDGETRPFASGTVEVIA